jgi:hypothetical protein
MSALAHRTRRSRVIAHARRLHSGLRRLAQFALVAGACDLACAAPREVALSATMPQLGDHTVLSWRDGPPYVTHAVPIDASDAAYSSDRRYLRLATGYFAADFDTEKIAITGFARRPAPASETAVSSETLTAAPLPLAELQLAIRVGELVYRCTGRRPLARNARGQPSAPLDFPVRIIESGRFFQKFTLHELSFHTADGQALRAAARLEVSAWADHLTLVLVVHPEESFGAAEMSLRLETTTGTAATNPGVGTVWPAQLEQRAVLTVPGTPPRHPRPGPAEVIVSVTPAHPQGHATVIWQGEASGPTISLHAPRWPAAPEGNYPEAMLDAWEAYAVTVENHSAHPQTIRLTFEHNPVKSIIGYVPMIVDPQGRPTGLPVQISKNWHQAKATAPLPYAGAWMHGRTQLNVPAHARVAFQYGTTFARWGGLPAASVAQLSLVGWGHNGFWDQLALGAFGESICFQPGRVMRRAWLTDFRPLFQKGFAKDERWAWTSNVGGGDTMVRLDPQGRYVPFKANVTRYASHGPNLAHVIYEEISADHAIRSRTEVFLPRTDDCLRVYVRLHYEITQRVEFSRLAFFQLGADFYNDQDAPLIAWGDARGLTAEHRPTPKSGARLLPPAEARGDAPWLSLHGEARSDLAKNGQASRGLIVRAWRATLGGQNVPAPFFTAVASRGQKPALAAELAPPPGLTALLAGDSVDALIELLPVPLTAARYYGPDEAFAAALATDANTWRGVHREAAGQRPILRIAQGPPVTGWPLAMAGDESREVVFTLQGGLGWVPLRVTELIAADAVALFRLTSTGRAPVIQGDAARAYWQSDYVAATQRWSVTYNLPASARPITYVLVPRGPR